ncbi:ABC transporter substrate-binding protein [Rhodococcus zopfii]|uniref:ABC transporter substrate-binding protein n=1 Tax=Rhodococcus zopfii TaxID=43772 RepID=A0ABU3WRV8_9NOCA|nr:ABC transporter substrate-binding protein [Rhodococcus zopfii]
MKRTSGKLAAIAVALGALVLSGCSGQQEKEPTAPTTALTKPPIVVGTVCGCSGTSAPTHGRVDDVAEAWAASVNDSGGINGHPVKVIVKDIGQEPSKALAAVKSLVEEEGAIAIVGPITGTTGSWRQYVEEKGIPVVGGSAVRRHFPAERQLLHRGFSQPGHHLRLGQARARTGHHQTGCRVLLGVTRVCGFRCAGCEVGC